MSRKLKNIVNYMNNNNGSHSDYKDVTKFYGGMSFTKNNFKRKQTGGGKDGEIALPPEEVIIDVELAGKPESNIATPVSQAQTVGNMVAQNTIPPASVQIIDPMQLLQQNPNALQPTTPPPVEQSITQQMRVPPLPITQPQPTPTQLGSPVIPINPTTYNTNAYLPLPHIDAQPYTIKAGTILYCGSLNRDHGDISATQIQTEHGNNLSFFTPNFRLAFGRIGECAINPDKSYVHAYEAKTDIPNIFIKHDFVTSMTFDDIQNNICANSKYNGVGFFYPANEIENFNAQITGMSTGSRMYAEFFLCNPFAYLVHLNTQKCIGTRKLGVIQQ